MILIAHRGNTDGINKDLENSLDYIKSALDSEYNVEIYVYYYKNSFYLGHDYPKFKISKKFLNNPSFWIHAKNFDALMELKKFATNFFWHENDSYTITNRGFFWTYPNKKLGNNSIAVCLKKKHIKKNVYGICSDFVKFYRTKNYERSNLIGRSK